ncbi:MAG: phage tail protein [Polyangiaceae bacterium]
MSEVRLPDLIRRASPGVSGWCAVGAHPDVSVPSLEQARQCALVTPDTIPACEPRVVELDLENGATVIAFSELAPSGTEPAAHLVVHARIQPGIVRAVGDVVAVPALRIRALDDSFDEQTSGELFSACGDALRWQWQPPPSIADGLYELTVVGYEQTSVVVRLFVTLSPPPTDPMDPCALTLLPGTRKAGIGVSSPPATFPRPPLLSVESSGCVVSAWSAHSNGYVLVPSASDLHRVEVWRSCRGGLVAVLDVGAPVRDAIFWQSSFGSTFPGIGGLGVVALATADHVFLFDLHGCPRLGADPDAPIGLAGDGATPLPFGDVTDALALGLDEAGNLLVIAREAPQVRVFRTDGSELLARASFPARGWYASRRSAAFVFTSAGCGYQLEPGRVGDGCCVEPNRALTEEESLFFRLIDDLSALRARAAYPSSGSVILGPGAPEDALDARRPGVQWHRVLLFGEIPDGCAVRIETRAFDDLVAGDPLEPGGWSKPVVAGPSAAVPVSSPGDTRVTAGEVLVLAPPGRYLWLRLTLQSNGGATPRLTSLELEQPREGIGQYLPEVFQNSTPEDDFLRRWLALFESTAFDGVAQRLDAYSELFDPRYAPEAMLPFLAEWLQVLDLQRLREDPPAFRRALARAADLAKTRGTVDGLILAVKLYLDLQVQIVESFKTRSGFILGAGVTLQGVTGPVLGCHTGLSVEPSGMILGDSPLLGDGYLLECETRTGTVPSQFEVWVPARDVCRTEDLAALRLVVDTEKPAHTHYCVRETGASGWVLGLQSVVGQELGPEFDRNSLNPATYGLVLANGPGRPKPLGEGLVLGRDSRLAAKPGQPTLQLGGSSGQGLVVGQTTRIGTAL